MLMKSLPLLFCLLVCLLLTPMAAATASSGTEATESVPANASDTAREAAQAVPQNAVNILKTAGIVRVLRAGEIRKRQARPGQTLAAGDMLITYTGSTAVLQLADEAGKVVVDESSRLQIRAGRLAQENGQVYYEVEKKQAVGQLVETDFATLGVKGTRFIVNVAKTAESTAQPAPASNASKVAGPAASRGRVALAEGELAVTSPDEPYEIKGFEDFKARHLDEFERFVKEQQQAFAEFKQSFTLQAGQSVSFEGRQATGTTLNEQDKARFKRYRTLLSE